MNATWQTIYMTLVTAIIAGILGILIGIALVITGPNGICQQNQVYWILDKIVNLFRSIPFIILLAVIAPLTRLIVGTSIGTTASIVPLIIGTVPFYARQVQNSLLDVDPGIIEAAQAMGSGNLSIIFRVYLKESLPSLIRTSVITLISLISLTAMAGTVGGGGLGNLAIMVGYNRFESDVTVMSLIIVLVLVFAIQIIGDLLAKWTDHENADVVGIFYWINLLKILQKMNQKQDVKFYEKKDSHLVRSLTTKDFLALGVGTIVSTAIFTLPGIVAASHTGPAVRLSFVLAAVVAGLVSFNYAEVSSTLPFAGSAYSWISVIFGKFWGWIVGWSLIAEYLIAVAFTASGISANFRGLVSPLGLKLPNS
ncbi:MAG: Hypothetical protein AJITA_00581 [Acetilactobacillus jinshanensis]